MDANLADMIAHARLPIVPLPTMAGRTTGIKPAYLKAVLLVIASHEGEWLPHRQLAERVPCAKQTALQASLALRSLGLVRGGMGDGRGMRCIYTIDRKKLASFVVRPEPSALDRAVAKRDRIMADLGLTELPRSGDRRDALVWWMTRPSEDGVPSWWHVCRALGISQQRTSVENAVKRHEARMAAVREQAA